MAKVLIIGGSGYVGTNLASKLLKTGHTVLTVDINPPPSPYRFLRFEKVDVTDGENLAEIMVSFQAQVVIHLASWGMSGSPMLDPKCRLINVKGAQETINASLKANVTKLIYTSTYNVVFGGEEIANGDEQCPYFPQERHTDLYSGSKATAEQIVLAANGKATASGRTLITSVIRPAAIYGENEQRHFPRIIKHIDSGIFVFRIGQATVDWVHVENLVESFEKLIAKLDTLKDHTEAPAGNAYFISDGSPLDNFEFLRPLCTARGCPYPSVILPVLPLIWLGWILESVYRTTKFIGFPVEPFLTRAEVFKVGITHYFSIEKSKKDFGYNPLFNSQQGAERVAIFYRQNLDNTNFFRLAGLVWWVLCNLGMSIVAVIAFELVDTSSNWAWDSVHQLGLLIFRSQLGLKILFILAALAHVIEASIALSLASSLGCKSTLVLWGIQTLLLGWPSLSLLYERKAFMETAK